MEDKVSINYEAQGVLHRYYVRNDNWGWGIILIDPRNCLVLCYTDYGNYNFAWPHHGEKNPLHFLPKLSFDYAMGKFRGRKTNVDVEASAKGMRRFILESRRDESYTAEKARELWNAVCEAECENGGEAFSHSLYHSAFGNAEEWYDFLRYEHPAECRGFWDHIWRPLMDHIKAQEAQPVTA